MYAVVKLNCCNLLNLASRKGQLDVVHLSGSAAVQVVLIPSDFDKHYLPEGVD